jgi:hypothetical protein
VFPNVFFVTGGFNPLPGLTITRNMMVVRQGEELVVVNSVRLGPEGEAQLAKLGTVKHVVRLGAFHGIDDPYYADRYNVPVWGPPKLSHASSIKTTRTLSATDGPIDDATIFTFDEGKVAEAAIVLDKDDGVLLTCDSFQNWTTFDGCSFMGKLAMKAMGFGPTLIGPQWVKAMGPAIRNDLERLTKLHYRHLLSAHGTPLRDTAIEGLRGAMAKRFKN